MGSATVRGGMDTYAGSVYPAREHSGEKYLKVKSGDQETFIYFRVPAPRGATVTSAYLRLYAAGPSTGSRTLSATRVGKSWKQRQVTWNNRPAITGSAVTKAVGTLASTNLVEFNVTSHVQSIVNGAANYGWKITTTGTTSHAFYGLDAAYYKPVLVVTWSDAPKKPTTLKPSGGIVATNLPTLQFDYTDVSGSTTLGAVQVKTSTLRDPDFPDWDSGPVNTTIPELNLAQFAGEMLPNTGFETNITGWNGPTFNSTWARSTAQFYMGVASLAVTATAAGDWGVSSDDANGSRIVVKPNQTYTASTWTRAGATARSVKVGFVWYDAANTVISTVYGSPITSSTTAWNRVAYTAVAPSNAATCRIRLYVTGGAAAEVHYFDEVHLGAGIGSGGTPLTALTGGGTTSWQVRVQDEAGLWSVWSDWSSFTYTAQPVVTITNPPVSGVINDLTPPISWTFSGTQTAWQVRITEADHTRQLYDSGKRTGTDNSHSIPAKVMVDDRNYAVQVRVWDNVAGREAVPGAPTWATSWTDFHVDDDLTITSASSFTAVQRPSTPLVDLTWTRASMPDSWTVYRDDKAIAQLIDPADVLVSGTTYAWTDHGAAPNRSHTYSVRAVVNSKMSAAGSTATLTPKTEGVWLIDPDRDLSVLVMGDDAGTWEMPDDAAVYTPIGGTQSIRIVSGMRGLEGSMSGYLVGGVMGLTFSQQEANLWAIKQTPSDAIRLVAGDVNIPVIVGNISVAPTPQTRGGDVVKALSFDFWQTGELPFQFIP